MKSIRTCLFPILLLVCTSGAIADTPALKADEILGKAIARAKYEEKNELLKDIAWDSRAVEEKLDKSGNVQERTDRSFEAVLLKGKVFRRCIAINGKPLTADALKKEAEREKKFRENAVKPPKQKDDDGDEVELDQELISRYHFSLVGQEQINGRAGYVLTFLPRANTQLPEKKKMDKLLNRLQGKVWLDTSTFSILKLDMHLTEPTNLMAGLGNVRTFDFLLEFAPVADGDLLAPKTIQLRLDGRKLFTALRVKQENHFSNHRKTSELKKID